MQDKGWCILLCFERDREHGEREKQEVYLRVDGNWKFGVELRSDVKGDSVYDSGELLWGLYGESWNSEAIGETFTN